MSDKQPTPQQAKTRHQIASLDRDNVSTRRSWMLVDEGKITITEQQGARDATASVSMPRKDFDRFVRWYTTGEWAPDRPPGKRRATSKP